MGRVAALSRHPLPCGPASCARRGDPLSRRAHSSHVLLSMCKRSALCAFSVANRGTVYSLLSLTHRQEEALFYTPQQPHAMTLPKDIKRTLMQVRRAFGLWSLEANDGRRWELGACVVCPHAQVVECVSECGVLSALRIELMPGDGLCPARWPVRFLSVVGVRGSRSGLRSGPLALRALSSGVGGGAAVLNLSVRLSPKVKPPPRHLVTRPHESSHALTFYFSVGSLRRQLGAAIWSRALRPRASLASPHGRDHFSVALGRSIALLPRAIEHIGTTRRDPTRQRRRHRLAL